MNIKALIVRSITLLFRESQLPDLQENSADMINTVLSKLNFPENTMGIQTEFDIMASLRDYCLELCKKDGIMFLDKDTTLQHLKVLCGSDEKLYEAFEQGIGKEYNESTNKRVITNLRQSIMNYYREEQVRDIVDKASYKFKFKRDTIKDVSEYISELMTALEPFQISNKLKDPAVVGEVDIESEEGMSSVFEDVKNVDNGDGIIQFGWQDLNRMLGGGPRRGDSLVIGALQHKYKTGFSLSLFCQAAQFNIPYMLDNTKKPLLLRISFEDDLDRNFKFMFVYLASQDPDMKDFEKQNYSKEFMSAYVRKMLQVNKYHIRFLRVDPTQWTYRHVMNKIIELEAEGYEIHLLMLDYLTMLPTTGCITNGPTGSDIRDMYRRMRNFCSIRKILFITPHQLSTEAKMLIREGRENFVKEVSEKGYYDRCRTLDQEVDIEIYIHIENRNGQSYLTVQRGKHRGADILEEDEKYFVLPFPKRMPIPADIDRSKISLPTLPSRRQGGYKNNQEDEF